MVSCMLAVVDNLSDVVVVAVAVAGVTDVRWCLDDVLYWTRVSLLRWNVLVVITLVVAV